MEAKSLNGEKEKKQLFFQKIQGEQLDQIYYSTEYLDIFFGNPLLSPTKLVIQPLNSEHRDNLSAIRDKFGLSEKYQTPLVRIAEKIFTLGSFIDLLKISMSQSGRRNHS
jgi:hypothetical protein